MPPDPTGLAEVWAHARRLDAAANAATDAVDAPRNRARSWVPTDPPGDTDA